MSLFSGAVNIMELAVPETVEFTEKKLSQWQFQDIDDTYDNHSAGWVSPLDMFDVANLALVLGDYVVLSMRIDERKVSSALLKKLVAKEERRVRIENQVPKLSRAQRVVIKERIRTELVRKAKPTSITVEVVWNVTDRRLFFLAVPGASLEVFSDLFKQTFGGEPELVEYEKSEDFLAWCWWKSEVINMAGRMTIGEGADQQVVCAEGPEAFKALGLGKKISQAQIRVDEKGTCTLAPGLMVFKGAKLPAVADEGLDSGLVLERIHLITELVDAVLEEWKTYLDADLSSVLVEQWAALQNS